MKRGWNLRRGHPDDAAGRSAGGKLHAARNTEPIDDSGRTHSCYYGQVSFYKLAQRLGSERAARDYMSSLGRLAWAKEMREFSHYLGLMREKADG